MLKPLLCLLLGFQATTGTIQVSVHLAGTTTPLAGVDVTLTGLSGGATTLASQKTDDGGRAVFSNLPSGAYRLRAERAGYFRKDETVSSPYAIRPSNATRSTPSLLDGLVVSVSPTQWSPQVSIAMVASGSIYGRVTDKDGVPLKDLDVSAGSIQYLNGRRVLDEWIRIRTGGNGEYRFASLGPGEYYVRADLPNVERGYAGTYYPGETDVTKATWITVRGGDEVGGVDVVLASPKTFNVSGKVLNLPKRTLPDGRIVNARPTFALIPRDARVPGYPFAVELVNELTTDDGDFRIRGVPAGSWDLIPVITNDVRSISDPRKTIGRVQIEVFDEDVSDVIVTINSNSVVGRTRMTGGEPVPIPLLAMLIPRDNTPIYLLNHLTMARTLPFLDGRFVFEAVPPGKYSFQFEAIPAGYYLADIRQGARSIYDDGIIEVGTQPPDPLEIVMGRGGGRVGGKVQGLPEKAVAQEYSFARVVLAPAKRGNLMLYQVVALSTEGQFSFSYVAPGEYKIFALKNLPNGAEKSQEFLSQYEALGTLVSVAAGASSDVQVSIIRNDP